MKNFNSFYQCHVLGQDSMIWQLQCHLHIIYQDSGQQIAIIAVQNCDISWFIPTMLEKLATQIVKDFHLNPDHLIWIQHDQNYNSRQINTEYSEITFHWNQGVASHPQWEALNSELIESLMNGTLITAFWGKHLNFSTENAFRHFADIH